MKDPPPVAVPAELSKVPEPVRRKTSPAAIGVPGIVFCAIAILGPVRLNEYDEVAAWALTVIVASAATASRVVIANIVVFPFELFMPIHGAGRDMGRTGASHPPPTNCTLDPRFPYYDQFTVDNSRMDAKDVRIFCEITFKGPSVNELGARDISPSGIGRQLGLDEKTVRVRVKKMEEDGFIKGYQAIPSFALFGLKSTASYRFEAINIVTKHNAIEHAKRLPHVVDALDYIGPHVAIRFVGTSASDIQSIADSVASRFELTKLILGGESVLSTNLLPDKLDWQIMQKLRHNARCPAKEVAKALGITPRMAEYRIRKMLTSGALLVRAMIDPRKQQGLIFYELEVSASEPQQSSIARQLEKQYGEKLWSIQKSRAGILLVSLFGFTLGEPEEAVLSSLRLEGVRGCSVYILKEMIEPLGPSWIDNIISQNIA